MDKFKLKTKIFVYTVHKFKLNRFCSDINEIFESKEFILNTDYYLAVYDENMKLISNINFRLVDINNINSLIFNIYNDINTNISKHKWRKSILHLVSGKSFMIMIKDTPFNHRRKRKLTTAKPAKPACLAVVIKA